MAPRGTNGSRACGLGACALPGTYIMVSLFLYRSIQIWLYLDAEVLVLPPVFLPQDSVFGWPPTTSSSMSRAGFLSFPVPFSLRVSIRRSTGILGIPLPVLLSNIYVYIYVYIYIYI